MEALLQPHKRTGPVVPRHVDKLDPLPDELLKQQDKAYLERFKLDKLFGDVLEHLIVEQPNDAIQYIIDFVSYNADYARQDPETGLPEHRKTKLMDLFRAIDKDGSGKISFRMLQQYTNKYGGHSLSPEELRSIFGDFKAGSDNMITQAEFLVFFSKVSKTIINEAFESMIKELLQ